MSKPQIVDLELGKADESDANREIDWRVELDVPIDRVRDAPDDHIVKYHDDIGLYYTVDRHVLELIGKDRVYIDDPSEAPEGADVREGERGGLYYERPVEPTGEDEPDESEHEEVEAAIEELDEDDGEELAQQLVNEFGPRTAQSIARRMGEMSPHLSDVMQYGFAVLGIASDSNDSLPEGVTASRTASMDTVQTATGGAGVESASGGQCAPRIVSETVGKERRYIDDPSEAPDGAEVHEGEQGGLYYETEATEDDLSVDRDRIESEVEEEVLNASVGERVEAAEQYIEERTGVEAVNVPIYDDTDDQREWLVNMATVGELGLTEGVEYISTRTRAEGAEYAAFTFGEDILWFDPEKNINDLEGNVEDGYAVGESMEWLILHEIGHAEHGEATDFETIEEAFDSGIAVTREGEFDETRMDIVDEEVGQYAWSNPGELVAEVFAGLAMGQEFSDEVMAMYEEWNGPDSWRRYREQIADDVDRAVTRSFDEEAARDPGPPDGLPEELASEAEVVRESAIEATEDDLSVDRDRIESEVEEEDTSPDVVEASVVKKVDQEDLWIPYQGPQGGVGWQNVGTGDVVYEDEPPGQQATVEDFAEAMGVDEDDMPEELRERIREGSEYYEEETPEPGERWRPDEQPDNPQDAAEAMVQSMISSGFLDHLEDRDRTEQDVVDHWESELDGVFENRSDEMVEAVDESIELNEQSDRYIGLLESLGISDLAFHVDAEAMGYEPGAEPQAERTAGATFVYDPELGTRDAEHTTPEPGVGSSAIDLPSTLRHESIHDAWDVVRDVDPEFREWFRDQIPDGADLSEELTSYAGSERVEEVFVELMTIYTSPEYDPDRFPDWVDEVASETYDRLVNRETVEASVVKQQQVEEVPDEAEHLPADEEPPEGARVVIGPRGGRYILPDDEAAEDGAEDEYPPPEDPRTQEYGHEDFEGYGEEDIKTPVDLASDYEDEIAQGLIDGLAYLEAMGLDEPVLRAGDEPPDEISYVPRANYDPLRQYIFFDPVELDEQTIEEGHENNMLAGDSVKDLVCHEAMHGLHFAELSRDRAEEMTFEMEVTDEESEILSEQVSDYATKNPMEVVAEIGSLLLKGEDVSDEVLQIYHKYGGPQL